MAREKTVQDVINTMTSEQKWVMNFLVLEAKKSRKPRTVQDVFNSMTAEQKKVVYYVVGEALG